MSTGMSWLIFGFCAGFCMVALGYGASVYFCRKELNKMQDNVSWSYNLDVPIKLDGGVYDHERRGDFGA